MRRKTLAYALTAIKEFQRNSFMKLLIDTITTSMVTINLVTEFTNLLNTFPLNSNKCNLEAIFVCLVNK